MPSEGRRHPAKGQSVFTGRDDLQAPRRSPETLEQIKAHRCLRPDEIYIGRGGRCGLPPSIWANPFKAKSAGGKARAVQRYRAWLPQQPHFHLLYTLTNTTLICHCSLREPCHGDVLIHAWHTHGSPGAPAPAAHAQPAVPPAGGAVAVAAWAPSAQHPPALAEHAGPNRRTKKSRL